MSTSAPFPSPTKIWHNTSYPAIDAKKPSLSAAGKNVAITGGGAGIGFRVARSFAEAGASSIAILGRTEQTLLDTKAAVEKDFPAVNIFTYVADITKKKEVDEAFSAYVAKVGELHVLVNNAGNGKVGPSVKDADVDEWMYTLEVNVKGSLLVAQAFLRSAVSDAVLINMTSLLSYLPVPAFSAYVASKCASVSLFDTLQLENPNVRVANLHPGIVDTAMTRGAGGTPMDDGRFPCLNKNLQADIK